MLDVDIKDYFGSIDLGKLESTLRAKIKDRTFMQYIIRMFKAGILRRGELVISEEGVMQGSICSPILANIFGHYVIDEWFEDIVEKHCKGKVKLFRYCDDVCIMSQLDYDAERIQTALAKRLDKFKLQLNKEKTTRINFKKGAGGSFDFLGFTFYWGKSRKGNPTPMVKTAKKRFRSKLKKLGAWVKEIRNMRRLKEIWDIFKTKIAGHIQYYGVSFNMVEVNRYVQQATEIMFRWLNKRSQKKSFDWYKFKKFMKASPLPRVRICHRLY